MGLLTVRGGVSLTLPSALGTLFLPLTCLVQLQCQGFLSCLIVSCCVLSVCCLMETCSFLKGKGEGVDLGERARLGGMEGEGTVVGMYCMREESTFNKIIKSVELSNTFFFLPK